MPSQTQRAQPRVTYPVEVRLSTPSRDHVLPARSVNLSITGILLEVAESLEVGTPVVCEIPLPGGSRQIPGLVARMQPLPLLPPGFWLGIRFVQLDPGVEEVLRALVQTDEPPSRLARVRFEGVRETWRSQAFPTADGIRLATVLPFLRTGCELTVAFVTGSSRVLNRGVVREVRIEPRQPDGVPRLAVDVQFPRERDPDYVAIDSGEEVTAVESPQGRARLATSRAVPAGRSGSDPTAPRPTLDARALVRRSARRPLHLRGRPRLPRVSGGRGRRLSLRPGTSATLRLAAYAGAVLALIAFGSALARWSENRRPTPAAGSALSPVARRVPPQVAPAAGAQPTAPTPPAPLPPAGAPAAGYDPMAGLPPLPASAPGPSIKTLDRAPGSAHAPGPNREIEAEVPFAGSAEGAIHYALAQPRGLAIDLPHARSLLALGRHSVQNEGFRYVWIRARDEGGIQLRFMFAYRTPQLRALEVDEGFVRVRVAPLPPESR